MYFKENDFNQMVSRGRSDERVAGKINLQMGVMAVILFLGGIGVLLLAGMGQIWLAVAAGVLAAALLGLSIWDPAHVFKKHARRAPGVYNPESRE